MKKAILLVDQCSQASVVYRTVLESYGYRVHLAGNPQQVQTALKDDALVLVIGMCLENADKLKLSLYQERPEIPLWLLNNAKETISSKDLLAKVKQLITKEDNN